MTGSSKRHYRDFRRRRTESRRAGRESPGSPQRFDGDRVALPPAARRRYLREYVSWLRPFVGSIVGVFVLALSAAALSLIFPRATMYIIDDVLPRHDWRLLHAVGGGLLAITLVQQLLDFLRNWQLSRLNSRVIVRLRERLFAHLLRLPLHQLADMKTGGIVARLSGDVDSATGLLQMAIITPGVAGAKVLLTLVMLVAINWKLALAALVMIPPIVVLNLVSIRRIRPIYRSIRQDRSEIDARTVETFGGIRVVRAFRREAAERRRYAVGHHTVMRKVLLARFFEHMVASGWGFIIPLSGLCVFWFGGWLVLRGQATVGGLIAFQMYLMMLLVPVSVIVHSYGETQQSLAAMERIFDLLRREVDKPDRPGAVDAPRVVESIEFDDVTFGYDPGRPVVRDFTLRVPGGATVALVGPSGAGKTTVTNLVARFYDPDRGAIRLNGIDLRDIRLASYRRLIGLVQQEVFLFEGTVAENIAYGRRGVSRAQIEDAARRANAHEFVSAFEHGYDTLVGERGVRLSGGQAQRISIARALLADPQLLILDEATSNLDTQSEQLIQASLRELMSERTTFVIAHRLSTVMNADLIVVMEDGRIVECGTHAELMAADTRYRAMVERQQRGLMQPEESAVWLA